MTRKDYVAIAQGINNGMREAAMRKDEYTPAFWDAFTKGLKRAANETADVMARDNARFDRERFLKACGL